jgi:hypothetical protein
MTKRRNQIAGQFVSRPRQLVESAAMRVLSLAAHQALMRMEVEHLSHGGVENGKLPVTYRQFEEWGVRRHSVASAIRELVALGIVEIARRGYSGAADVRMPSLYRLTYVQAWDANDTGTHEYLRVGSVGQAEAIAAAARKGSDPRNVERGRKNFATPQNVQGSAPKTWGTTPISRPPKRGVHARPPKRGAPSISRVGTGADVGGAEPSRLTLTGLPLTTPSLPLTVVANAPQPDDVFPSQSPTDHSAGPKLVWRAPVVAELFGDEARARRAQVERTEMERAEIVAMRASSRAAIAI